MDAAIPISTPVNRRNRIAYLIVGGMLIVLGLAARRYPAPLPAFLAPYLPDALWALMVFVLVGFLAPRWSRLRVGGAALAVAFAVEIGQMYHAPWIDGVRHTRLGGLVLGYGFLWSDLLCYTAGVTVGVVIEAGIACAVARRHRSGKRIDLTGEGECRA